MAKLFQVTLPEGASKVKLDSQGRATVPITVKNVSARPIDVRGVLVSLPRTTPPSGVVEKGWVKIDGKAERHFDVDKDDTFTVRISVPPKSSPGPYLFRLDAVWVDKPDEGDSSSDMGFVVPAAPDGRKTTFPLWLIPVLVLVVIGLGVGVWLLIPRGPTVPDLHGKTISEALTTLGKAHLTMDHNMQTVEGKPEDSGKIVSQKPDARQKATEGQSVQVTVGAQMVAVPLLIGHPFQDVQKILNDKQLVPGQSTVAQNPNFAGGVVFDQSPTAQQMVKTQTAVDVRVTPQIVSVRSFLGQNLASAILSLQAQGLTLNSIRGDNTKTVTEQEPAPGASVPVGSSVTLSFPLGDCGPFPRCILVGPIVHQLALEQAVHAREVQRSTAPPQ